MFTVGLTGGIGSGKSSVARLFADKGVTIVDADEISHRLTAAGGAAIEPIRAAFGDEMITPDGALDRPRMRALVFSAPDAKGKLERILHPLIRLEARHQVDAARSPYVIHMIPLLVESGNARARFDRVLVVDCPEAVQIERVTARSGLTRAEVEAIMATQASRAQRLTQADDIVDNSGDPAALEAQIEHLHAQYLQLATTR
ncbi:MAG TPA: dephospho-CoA kinase [Burkholderiales bacterium]